MVFITTYFRPSIHAWHFGNRWYDYSVGAITLGHGCCGGMCWRALYRFYNAIPMDVTDDTDPVEGDALYEELAETQTDSCDASTVDKMWDWQQAPDLDPKPGHPNAYAPSLGRRTLHDWYANVKPNLDNSKPLTLTLIASSNDHNVFHLGNHHRVIAYAYEDNGTGAVDILIYDPNCRKDDDVRLTFITNGERHAIHLSHNRAIAGYKGVDYKWHGFFLDDADRHYSRGDSTNAVIVKCVPKEIISATRAMYDLEFKWSCRFIPYFVIQVDGVNWNYNNSPPDDARFKYDPLIVFTVTDQYSQVWADHKQCPTNNGSLTMPLKLPRQRCRVAVRLLNADTFTTSIDVDAQPSFSCLPYVHKRGALNWPGVSEERFLDTDLFIKIEHPTAQEVQNLDTSPFRWVWDLPLPNVPRDPDRDPIFIQTTLNWIDKKRLGNIVVPVLGDFVAKNLAPPISTSGNVYTTKNGRTVRTYQLTTLGSVAQKIFDGFTDNPADYDGDTTVRFDYLCTDKFATYAGSVYFYGKSIIRTQMLMGLTRWSPEGFKILAAIIWKMTEKGLIGRGGGKRGLKPPAIGELRTKIDQTINELWSNKAIWKDIERKQLEISKQESRGKMLEVGELSKPGEILAATDKIGDARTKEYDEVIIYTFAEQAIDRLRKDPSVKKLIKYR